MRSFIVSSLLFIILITATLLNSFFICSRADRLIDLVNEIPSVDADRCNIALIAFDNEWQKFKKAAAFTTAYSELNKISCVIEELYVHLENKNKYDFDHCIATLRLCLSEISRLEKISVDSVF